MKAVLQLAAALIIGIFLLVIGFNSVTNDGPPTCGSRTMSPGDTCISTKGSKSTKRSYSEQQSKDRRGGWAMIVVGGLFVLGGGGAVLLSLGGDKKNQITPLRGPGVPSAGGQPGFPPQQPGFPPQQPGFPPQQPGFPPQPQSPTGGFGQPVNQPPGYLPPPPPPGPHSPHTRGQ